MATDNPSQLSFEQPRSAFGTWIGVVLLFLVFGLLVWAVMGVMPRGDNYEAKRAKVRAEKLKTASDEAAASLHSYGWVDKEKGLARIPIQRAMELSVAELAQKKPAPANPIATPAPAVQETAPVAPSPAPSVSPGPSASPTPVISISGRDSENRGQPAGANNPPGAAPGTQPGASATPAATPPVPSSHAQPGTAPSTTPAQVPPGTPLPIPGKTP